MRFLSSSFQLLGHQQDVEGIVFCMSHAQTFLGIPSEREGVKETRSVICLLPGQEDQQFLVFFLATKLFGLSNLLRYFL